MKQKVLTIRATADIMITGKEVRAVNTNARVKAVREAAGLSQDEFARKLGFKSRGAITNIERELTVPSENFLALVSSVFNVREQWLRTGEGDMLINPDSEGEKISAFIAQISKDDDASFRKRFVEMLAGLSPADWELLERMAEKLTQKKEESP